MSSYKYICYGIVYQSTIDTLPKQIVVPKFPLAFNEFCKLGNCYFKRLYEIVGFKTKYEEQHPIIDVQNSDGSKMVVFSSFCYIEESK